LGETIDISTGIVKRPSPPKRPEGAEFAKSIHRFI
jgi:hypothetical protein